MMRPWVYSSPAVPQLDCETAADEMPASVTYTGLPDAVAAAAVMQLARFDWSCWPTPP